MTAICNATPLINFAVIDRLDILQASFEQITIPQAVCDETTRPGFKGSPAVLQAVAFGRLQVRSVSTIPNTIPLELDDGEREVLALTLETGIQQVLLDEREARQVAQALGLQTIGTLGILLLAKSRQIILKVQPLLDAMITTAQYWVSSTLYQQVLQRAGEAVK